MSVILMTTLFYKALILQGEIWCWSLLGLKGLRHVSVIPLNFREGKWHHHQLAKEQQDWYWDWLMHSIFRLWLLLVLLLLLLFLTKVSFVHVTAPLHARKNLEFYQKSLRALFKAPLRIFFTFVVEWVSYDFRKKIFCKQTQKKILAFSS